MSEKINFAWPVTSENAVIYHYFLSKAESIRHLLAESRIVIFGAGIRGCSLMNILEQQGFKNIIFCDNNQEKQGHLINSYDIISLNEALEFGARQVFLISPENSGSMSCQLIEAGLREHIDWFSFEVSAYDAYVAEYLRPVADHMLVMGDCAFTHIALADKTTDSLGEMMKAHFAEDRCKVLAMHGIGQQANFHITRSLLERGERPLLVFLLLVMEVLTPKAHIMPRTQHPALIHRLTAVAQNPNNEFIEYAKLAKERFDRFQVESFASFKPSAEEVSEKLYMRMNYLFKIREETEGVVYLKKTIKMFNDESVPVVLYVPPVNYMQGEKFFGHNFKQRYMDNFVKLYEFLDNEHLDYSVADASFLINEDEFAATNTIDETTNALGRNKLLEFLAKNAQVRLLFE